LVPQESRWRRVSLSSPPNLVPDGLPQDGSVLPAPPTHRPAYDVRLGRTPFRIGLLGCGEIGAQNAHAIADSPKLELGACFDPAAHLAEDVAARFGGASCRSSDELLAHSLDAVVIATPHHLHAPLALESVAAGLHVVVEKPLALNISEACEIVAAADRAGVALSTCFPFRYEEHIAAAKGLSDRGALRPLRGVLVNYGADKPPSYWLGGYSGRSVAPWRRDRRQAGGGVVVMNLCHYLDLVRYVAGAEVETVTARVDTGLDDDHVEDTAAVAIGYADGAVGSIFGSAVVRGAAFSEFRIWGELGQVLLEPLRRVYTLRVVD